MPPQPPPAHPFKVLVTGVIPAGPVQALAADVEVVRTGGRPATGAELQDADGVISILRHAIGPELFDAAPRLKVIANFAVGYDNVDVSAATQRRIVVCNTPDVLTDATADLTWGLLLAAARRVVEGDALVRAGQWQGWEPLQLLGSAVSRRTLGVIGLGRIGRAVARRAAGFDMPVLYVRRGEGPREAVPQSWRRVGLPELLAESDFVSVHVPLDDQTRGLLDRRALASMRPGSVLVNTARGGIVDEEALVDAVESGALAAAGLDVFQGEPQVSPRLRACQRIVLSPHIGSATGAAREGMARLCCEAVRAVLLEGCLPPNCVNAAALGDWP